MTDDVDDSAEVESEAGSELKGTGYELFIAALSVLSIANIILLYAVRDDGLKTVLVVVNVILSLIFLGDFAYRLSTAPSKAHYFWREFGWADLLASLPFEQAKILRVFRLFRVVRLLRQNGVSYIGRTLVRDRAGSALFMLLLLGLLVIQFGSLAILKIEDDAAGANITSASDAVWYVIVTMSTVGYGDQFPVTNTGRAAGVMIIVLGVGIFGAFTGYLANAFIAPRRKETDTGADDAAAQLERLRELASEQQAVIDDLERRLGRAS